jgi:hypothetical protein
MQAKRSAAGPAAPALGMPPLPAAEKQTSPGAAARAARQRKRKSTNMPEEFDERTTRMHKRMVWHVMIYVHQFLNHGGMHDVNEVVTAGEI